MEIDFGECKYLQKIWGTLPVIAHRTVSFDFAGLPIGEFLSFHVRAVGAKGFSPWTETATVRVN